MSKILYIEDELTKNIASLQKLFAPILKDSKVNKKLKEIETSEPIYPEDIIDACSKIPSLNICFTFPAALELIINHHQEYELFIIDRNLSTYQYSDDLEQMISALTCIGISNAEEKVIEYHEREGDLLLRILQKLNPANIDKVYFLTANTKDAIRGSDVLDMIDEACNRKDWIIEKGTEAESIITKAIADVSGFAIQNRYKEQCTILRKHLSETDLDQFIKMVKHYEVGMIKEFIFYLRKLLDDLLHDIAFNIAEPGAEYWNPKNKTQLQIKPFIKGIYRLNKFTKENELFSGLPAYDRKHRIGYNSIIRNACLSVFEITSDCGIHELSHAVNIESLGTANISHHTKVTLLNQICDIIVWYDLAIGIITSK